MTTILNWISTNYIELAGTVLGIIYVLLASRQNAWCWLAGIISCALYIAVFFSSKLYGDMLLQAFYLLVGFYGWYLWLRKEKQTQQTRISHMPFKMRLITIIVIGLMTVVFGYLLTLTDDPIPYWDGFTNALGLAATWMTARKYLENWWLWIFTNLLCCIIYYFKELYPTVIFYFIMAVLAYRAAIIWNKELNIKNDA